MYLSDYAFFTFTTAIIVFLMLIGIQEHIDSYTNWGKKIHTRLQKKLTTEEPIVETTSVRYEPPSKLRAEEIKQHVIKLHSKKQNDTKIMIAIPTHDRKGYTKFNADVIRLYHKIPSEQLFIFDDCSTQYGEKELREWYGPDINYFPCTKKLLADSNIRRMFKYFSTSNYDIIFSVDSDTLFQKQWRSFILDNINKTDGMMSLYHSAANWHQTYGCDDVLCKKKSLGSAGSVMRKDVVIKMLKVNKNGKKAGEKNFDWGFVEYFKKKGIKMFVPEKSLMFHYGRKGQNNKCGTYWDFAKDFDRSKMPKWIQKNMLKFENCDAKPNDILPSPSVVIDKPRTMWTVWYGDSIPFMYQIALKSMKKLYDVKTFKVNDDTINEIILQLVDIHPISTWKKFVYKIKNSKFPGPHYSDFLRIALIYLYGGIYSDFDALWIKELPPFKLLMVDKPSNGVIGGYPKNEWLRKILYMMPSGYDPQAWNSIIHAGKDSLLVKSMNSMNKDEFTFIHYKEMYTVGWTEAEKYYKTPYSQLKQVTMGYQLHMFGKMTELTKNTLPVKDSLYMNTIRDIGIEIPEHCKTPYTGPMATNFKSMVTILNGLRAPWKMHAGNILFWYRDCSLPNDDMDISIDLEWFRNNKAVLGKQLKEAGWHMRESFGHINSVGYEEAWIRNGKKCDLFSVKRVDNKYTSGLTINGNVNECSYTSNTTVLEKWGDLVIKVPAPIENVLTQFYGSDWRTPDNKYVWDKTPFQKGRWCYKN